VILPYVIVHNRSAIEPQLRVIARTLDLAGEPFAAFFDWVLEFRRRLRIPHTLAEIGVSLKDPDTIGREAGARSVRGQAILCPPMPAPTRGCSVRRSRAI